MKILQINNCHYRRGGADVVYLNTGELFKKNGHDVIYFSQKNINNLPTNSKNYFVESINFFEKTFLKKIRLIPRFIYSIESKKKINQLIQELNPEIAHIHTYKGALTPSILNVLKKNHIPIVISLHDYGFLCPHNLMLDGKMNICERCLNNSALNCIVHKCNRDNRILSTISAFEYLYHKFFFPFYKYFDTILAVSKFGQIIHNRDKKLKNVQHLYNFYPEIEKISPNNSKGSYFLYLGRLAKEKGIKTLVKAWSNGNRKHVLKIVGTGELLEELKHNSEDNIEILGFKQGEELNDLIRNASFIIVPSEWYENNPLTVIEAYANGKPVIGANVGGIPEIIDDNKTGYLFEMRNESELSKKISMAENLTADEYAKMSLRARTFAEVHFHPEKHYNRLIKIYNSTIDKYKYDSK